MIINRKINLNIKSIIMCWVALIGTFSFCGCNNTEQICSAEPIVTQNGGNIGIVTFSAEVPMSRSALPTVEVNDFTKFELYDLTDVSNDAGDVSDASDDQSDDMLPLGMWGVYTDM
ncbi:MAG: hypothetical protein J6W76_01255, partial [Spirochaetales bacterium]|nr:hypothetical protein [Spirochaetales bacterium]